MVNNVEHSESVNTGGFAFIDALLNRGYDELTLYNLKAAEHYFIRILDREPDHFGANLGLAVAKYVGKRDIDAEISLYFTKANASINTITDIEEHYLQKILNYRNLNGDSLLFLAKSDEHIDIVRLMCDLGIDVNAKNEYGYTALMQAAGKGNIKIIKELCERGSDVNAKYLNQNDTMTYNHLLYINASEDILAKCFRTALMLAVRGKHQDAINTLLEYGANPNDIIVEEKREQEEIQAQIRKENEEQKNILKQKETEEWKKGEPGRKAAAQKRTNTGCGISLLVIGLSLIGAVYWGINNHKAMGLIVFIAILSIIIIITGISTIVANIKK